MAVKLKSTVGKDGIKKRIVKAQLSKDTTKDVSPDEEPEQTESSKWSIKSMIKASFKYIFLAMIIPPLLNYAALIKEDKEFKRTGNLNETFPGQKLFVQCKGQGKPTVIMDAPTGLNSDVWIHVFNEVAKISKVCIYDRAGIGFSERPKMVNNSNKGGAFHTTERMVDDLRFLLSNDSQLQKPFLFVGAELGAVNVRFYAQMYQDDVSSVVLINPLYEGIFAMERGGWERFWLGPFLTSWQRLRILAACGLSRLGLQLGALQEIVHDESLPDDIKRRQKHLMCKPDHLYSAVEEHYFLNESLSQLRLLHRIRPLSNKIPVSVISSSKFSDSAPETINQIWKDSLSLNKKTFLENPTEIRTETAANKVILKEHNIISEQINMQIMKWRTDTKKSAKY